MENGNWDVWKINLDKFAVRLPSELMDSRNLSKDLALQDVAPDKQAELVQILVDPQRKPIAKVRSYYRFIDEVFSYTKGLLACRNGCSHCCYQAVSILAPEAALIEEETGLIAQTLPPTHKVQDNWIDADRPCPFLKKGACSIYKFRPAACRMYVNFDRTPAFCINSLADSTQGMPMLNRGSLFPHVSKAYITAFRGSAVGDIRDFFPKT